MNSPPLGTSALWGRCFEYFSLRLQGWKTWLSQRWQNPSSEGRAGGGVGEHVHPVQKAVLGGSSHSTCGQGTRGGGGKRNHKARFRARWPKSGSWSGGQGLGASSRGSSSRPSPGPYTFQSPRSSGREDALSGLSMWLESLTHWGDLGMETSLLYIQKQGYFWFTRAGSSLISWNGSLSSEPGAWAVLERQRGA